MLLFSRIFELENNSHFFLVFQNPKTVKRKKKELEDKKKKHELEKQKAEAKLEKMREEKERLEQQEREKQQFQESLMAKITPTERPG